MVYTLGGIIPPGFQAVPKLDADGKQLYLLPQPDLEVNYTIPRSVKTTEVTDHPVMTAHKVPLMENGVQKRYEVTRTVELTEEVTDAEGNVSTVVTGYTQEPTGQFLDLFTTEEIQETDEQGNALYWGVVEDPAVRYEPQEPKEITEDDPEYVEGLEQVAELVPIPSEPSAPQMPTIEDRVTALEGAVTSIIGL
jgi:hypothetical protein